jgi:hypothetical protein
MGVILTVAVLQAEGRISRRASTGPGMLHPRSLARLKCAGLGMTPLKEGTKIQTALLP